MRILTWRYEAWPLVKVQKEDKSYGFICKGHDHTLLWCTKMAGNFSTQRRQALVAMSLNKIKQMLEFSHVNKSVKYLCVCETYNWVS